MPELPEVEITKKTLQKYVQDQYITDVKIKNYNLRYKINKNFRKKIIKKNKKNNKTVEIPDFSPFRQNFLYYSSWNDRKNTGR